MRGLVLFVVLACACSKSYGDAAVDGSGRDAPGLEDGLVLSQSSDEILDFGEIPCNTASPFKLITLSNTSSEMKTYTLVLPGDPFVVDDPQHGLLAAGATASITVKATPTSAGPVAGALVFKSPSSFVPITLTTQGIGAQLDWSPGAADIGQVNKVAGGSTKVTLVNTGTVAANVASLMRTSGSADLTMTPSVAVVPSFGAADFTITLASGAEQAVSATFVPTTSGVCGPVPTMTAKGERVNSDVTVGTGDFGKRNCNASVGQKDIVIQNFAPVAKVWTVDPPQKFTLVSATGSGTLDAQPAGQPGASTSGTITVATTGTIATPGSYEENLVVHVRDSPGGANEKVFTVLLRIDVRGAVITFNPSDLTFNASVGATQNKTISIVNAGNEGINFAWDYNRTAGQAAWIVPKSASVLAGATLTQTVTYQPTAAPPNTATLTANTQLLVGGPVCNALPVVHLSGQLP